MTLLAPLKTRDDLTPGVVTPDEWIHDGLIREHVPGITQFGIIEFWDERRDNETNRTLRKRFRRRCPKCSRGRSWMKPYWNLDAYHCRWGHIVTGREIHEAGRR